LSTLSNKNFQSKNDPFSCLNCGKNVPPLSVGCRNHCPLCLFSLHVDRNPGDRSHDCGALMKPIDYKIEGAFSIKLTFQCQKCGEIKRNKAALDDKNEADSLDEILKIKPPRRL